MDSLQNLVDINDYIKIDEIGKGSYGSVWKVQNRFTKEFCAAKFLGNIDKNNEKYIVNEIKIMSEYPNDTIVSFIGYALKDFEGKDNIVIIMKLYNYGTLKNCNNFLSPRQKKNILAGIAFGMNHLHKNGIIHRDLKPANIFIDDNIKPIIADFGIAKKITKDDSEQTFHKYTPIYCAPEAFEAKYSTKSDVYSFAILMYELITKREPYPDIKNSFILYNFVTNGQRPKFFAEDKIDEKIKELIEKCWANAPEARPTFEDIFYKLSQINSPNGEYIEKLQKKMTKKKEKKSTKKKLFSNEIETKINSLEKENASLKERMSKQEDEIKHQTEQNEIKINEISNKYERMIINLTSSINKIEERMKNEVSSNNFSLKIQIDSLERENKSLKERMIRQERKIEHNEMRISELEDDYERMMRNLNSSIKRIEKEMENEDGSKRISLRNQIEALEKENESLREQMEGQ